MKRFCLWGTSLQKVADEAQFLSVVQAIEARFPDAKVTIFSTHGEAMAKLRPSVTVVRALKLHRVIPALATADLFVIVGGPFFEDPWQATICLVLVAAAKTFRCPTISYGITAFFFHTRWGRWFFRHLLNSLDVIAVRESLGIKILKDLGIKRDIALFADPRFLLTPASPETVLALLRKEGINPDEPMIAVSTRYLHDRVPRWVKHSHGYTDDRVTKANDVLARVIAYLSERAQILFIPLSPSQAEDQEMVTQLKGYVRDPSRLTLPRHRYSSPEIMGIISQCELLLASRLGSAVFATVTGTPIVAIAYEPRMRDHMERIGLGDCVFDWKDLQYDTLLMATEAVRSSASARRAHLQAYARQLKETAWENTDILGQYARGAHQT